MKTSTQNSLVKAIAKKLFLALLLLINAAAGKAQTWTKNTDFINGSSASAYAFTINDTIYVGNTGLRKFFKYDPVLDLWTEKADVPAELNNRTGSVGFAINGRGYVLGGVDNSGICRNDLWEYSPGRDIWTQKADFPGGKRAWPACFVIGSNAYIGGGIDTIDIPGFSPMFKNDLWKYDQGTNTWVQKADLPYDSSYLESPFSFSINNKGYISCGFRIKRSGATYDEGNDVNKTFQYDTVTNSWTQKADFPGARRSGGISFVLNNKAYCGTGERDTTFLSCYNDFFIYDPALNVWDTLAPIPFSSRTNAIAASLSTGVAYVGTGWHAPDPDIYYMDWWSFSQHSAGVTGMSNIEPGLSCYPNPCNNVLIVSVPGEKNEDYLYDVYNMVGQKVAAGKLPPSRTVNTHALPSGQYTLVVSGGSSIFRTRFEVQVD